MNTGMTHCVAIFDDDGFASHALVATRAARRLIVFIHGWNGRAAKTWGGFQQPPSDPWWEAADLLFVNYRSTKESATATADRLRSRINDFYPKPNLGMLIREGVSAREDTSTNYEELILVGHSLGGVVIRRALVDAMDEWRVQGLIPERRPQILDAQQRLFSPASAGFLPRGALAALHVAPIWWVCEMFLVQGGAYLDLKAGSQILESTRRRTESYSPDAPDASALAAYILWANPEKVVVPERYDNDARSQTADGRTHRTVCKPEKTYEMPFSFVQSGQEA